MELNPAGALLIVDDEADLRELFLLALSDRGFRIAVAASGREAIEVLGRERIAGILTDIRMADGTGLELLDHVTQQPLESRPFVILNSGFSDLTSEEALARGATALLCKPLHLDVLVGTVLQAMRGRQERARAAGLEAPPGPDSGSRES